MSSSQPASPDPSITALVQMRTSTDVEIPIKWLLLSLGSYLVWAIAAIALWSSEAAITSDLTTIISGLAVVGLGLSAGTSYLVFKLLDRINEHSTRTRSMLRAVIDSLHRENNDSDQQSLLLLSTAEGGFRNLAMGEKDRSAVLWALLSSIPFLGWAFLAISQWRLSRDLSKHNRMENILLEDVDRALRNKGKSIPLKASEVRPRDALGTALVVITIIELLSGLVLGWTGALVLVYLTIGALSLFWIDLSVKGPRQHFSYHSQLEPEIARAFPENMNIQTGVV